MMIGSPASVNNACQALEAGVNYIGNLSQFHWKYPGWPGTDAEQVGETVTALGVMAAVKAAGGDLGAQRLRLFCRKAEQALFARVQRELFNDAQIDLIEVRFDGLLQGAEFLADLDNTNQVTVFEKGIGQQP